MITIQTINQSHLTLSSLKNSNKGPIHLPRWFYRKQIPLDEKWLQACTLKTAWNQKICDAQNVTSMPTNLRTVHKLLTAPAASLPHPTFKKALGLPWDVQMVFMTVVPHLLSQPAFLALTPCHLTYWLIRQRVAEPECSNSCTNLKVSPEVCENSDCSTVSPDVLILTILERYNGISL